MRHRLITRGTLGQHSSLFTAKDFISVVLESCLRQQGEEFQEVVMSCYYCGSEGFIKTDQSRKIYSQRLQAKQFVILAVYSYLKSCINRRQKSGFYVLFSLLALFSFFFFIPFPGKTHSYMYQLKNIQGPLSCRIQLYLESFLSQTGSNVDVIRHSRNDSLWQNQNVSLSLWLQVFQRFSLVVVVTHKKIRG